MFRSFGSIMFAGLATCFAASCAAPAAETPTLYPELGSRRSTIKLVRFACQSESEARFAERPPLRGAASVTITRLLPRSRPDRRHSADQNVK